MDSRHAWSDFRILIVVASAALTFGAVRAENAAPEKPNADPLATIVKNLDSDRFELREKGHADLAAWVDEQWVDAESELKKHLPDASAEVHDAMQKQLDRVAKMKECESNFAWLEGLGFPDIRNCKFVHVATGEWHQSGNNPRENRYVNAFLLEDAGETFKIFLNDLSTMTLKKTPPGTEEYLRVAFEPVDLAETGAANLKALQHPPEKDDHWRRFGESLAERSEVFVFAHGCRTHGLKKLAMDLCAEAEKIPARNNQNPPASLRAALAQEIGHAQMWRLILDFENPKIVRAELLRRAKDFVKNFPESEHAGRAKETAELLEKMVLEDEAHAKAAAPLEKLTGEARIAELIFQLRDQNGHQWSQPGACDIFLDERKESSPAHQLVKIGYDAIPQLINVVDDQRFTRSVGYHRDFYFSHHVLRVGDCALAILESIAGRGFYSRTYTNAAMVKDNQAETTKAQIEKWWAAFKAKGEKQILIEGTESGDENAMEQAEKLVEKFPDASLAAIVKGVEHSNNAWVQSALVGLAAKLPDEGVAPFLLKQLSSAKFQSTRIAAAAALVRLKKSANEAIAAMIKEWSEFKPGARDDDAARPETLVEFLAGCGSVEAIEAMGKDLRKRPVDLRLTVVSAMRDSENFSMATSGPGSGAANGREKPEEDPKVVAAGERLLVAQLDDTEERTGMSGSWGDKSFNDPRICDIAGYILNQHWKKKYTFDLEASLADRDTQRIAAANIWRKENGQPPLPLPKRRIVERLPDEKVRPLLTRFLESKTDDERTAAAAELERLGLPALPALFQAEKGLNAEHAARPALLALERRVATLVVEVNVADTSVAPDADLKAMLDGLKDKPLTFEAWRGVLLQVTRHLPAGATGVQLSARRDADFAGITITLNLTHAKVHQGGGQKGWDTSENVSVGNNSLLGSSGTSSYDYQQKEEAFKDLGDAVSEALKAPADKPLQIKTGLIEEN